MSHPPPAQPPPKNPRVLNVIVVLLLGALIWAFGGKSRAPATLPPAPSPAQTTPAHTTGPRPSTPTAPRSDTAANDVTGVVANAEVENFGAVVYRGAIDLRPTLARIRRGEKLPFRDDGIVFGNRERRLPERADGYYHEYVHPTAGLGGPGPQRVVSGGGGEFFYTPNHYRSFVRVP